MDYSKHILLYKEIEEKWLSDGDYGFLRKKNSEESEIPKGLHQEEENKNSKDILLYKEIKEKWLSDGDYGFLRKKNSEESEIPKGDKNEEKEAAVKKEFGQTCDWIKKRLGEKVASVQISNRLSASPCVLVSGKFGWSANMEKLMKQQSAGGDTTSLEFMKGRRVFEINPDHSIIKNINAACKSNPNDEDALRAIDLMYDAALVSSGFTPENPAELGGKIYEMMGIALSGKWSSPEVQQQQQQMTHSHNAELLEAEVVEPVEVDVQK